MQPQVVCLGAINVDLVYQVDDVTGFLRAWGTGLTRGGEEVLIGEDETRLRDLLRGFDRPAGRFGGGQAANAAYALARLGFPAALVGHLGADEDGDFIRESLAGVNLDYVIQAGESGRAYILVDPGGERTILVAPNANEELRESDLPWRMLQQARFLHFTSFASDGPLALQGQIARRLQGGPRLSFDPGELYARRGRGILEELLDNVETLMVNEAEWAFLGGGLDSHPVWAPPIILIKRGPRGARLLTPVRYLDIPSSFEGQPVDTLGAGDVFAAGYIAGLLIGLNLPQAVRLAEYAAAYKLGGAGREGYPDKRVLERIIARLR
ncbi:MAG: carbohydrate kinase family protein [Deltaproteobacteria bacterium]|nr:carbohydrate kinase family protein [Deltaproteobacteria bacterium]